MSVTTPVHLHHDSPDAVGRRDRLGVILLIVADIAFVGSLMFSYMYLRFLNTEGAWMPEGMIEAPPLIAWIVITIMVIGLVAFYLGVRGMKAGKPSSLALGAGVALIAALSSLVFEIVKMSQFNFPLSDKGYFAGGYSSTMVTLAGANAFHLVLTIVITLGILNRARLGKYKDPASWQPRIATYWWLWVVVSALLVGLMTTFYVSSPYLPSMVSS